MTDQQSSRFGLCADCGTPLTGPGHIYFIGEEGREERICDRCQGDRWETQKAAEKVRQIASRVKH